MATGKYRDPNTGQFVTILGSSPAVGAQVGPTAPTPRSIGDLWVDTDDTVLTWDTTWQYPTLLSPWTDYLNGYPPTEYRKLPGGLVNVSCAVKGGTNNQNVFVLPVGYRPSATLHFVGIVNAYANVLYGVVGANGAVYFGSGTNSTFSYINFIFFADA